MHFLRPGIANPMVELTECRDQVHAAAETYEKTLIAQGFRPGTIQMARLNQEPHWVFNTSSPTGHPL